MFNAFDDSFFNRDPKPGDPEPGGSGQPGGPGDPGSPAEHTQQVKVAGISARVPAEVALGAFSTGTLVMSGPCEFVLDFLQQLSQPPRLVARVVLPVPVVPQVIRALEQAVGRYEEMFGKIPTPPRPDPGQRRIDIHELYESLKQPEEVTRGAYANMMMIKHNAFEFALDFIGRFFPNAVVTTRVYLSAPHIPSLLESLRNNYQQHLRQQPPPGGAEPEPQA